MKGTPHATVGPGSLPLYVAAATLARAADAGAAVGLVLLALATSHLPRPSLVGGVLVACLTAPHLVGPVLARRLDQMSDGRSLLAAAFLLYGLALCGATLSLGHLPVGVTAVLVVVAGLCGPLLTGGLSSRLAGLVRREERAQRRAQGWDAVTYGIGGSAGPAAVAAVASATNAEAAMLTLAAAAVLAAVVVLTLPRSTHTAHDAEALPLTRTLRLMAVTGPLRRLTYTTLLVAVPTGAVSVLAVAVGVHLRGSAVSGASLAGAYGIGNLAASLLVTAFPTTSEPEQLLIRCTAGVAIAFALCAAAPSYSVAVASFALLGASNAPWFAATLAARSWYSPPVARAQVFVTSAGLKVAASSAGTAAAGALLTVADPRALLFSGGALMAVTAGAAAIDRKRSGARQHVFSPHDDERQPRTMRGTESSSALGRPGEAGDRTGAA